MKKKSTPTKKIYRIKGKSMDEVIRAFRSVRASEMTKGLPQHMVVSGMGLPELSEEQKRENKEYDKVYREAYDKTIRENLLKEKFEYLIHILIARSKTKKDFEWFSLNATILEEIFGKDYRLMLRTLRSVGLTSTDQVYNEDGNASNMFIVDKEMTCSTKENPLYLSKWFKKGRDVFDKHKQGWNSKMVERLGGDEDMFIRYNESLSRLKMVDPDGARVFVENKQFETEDARDYYEDIIDRFGDEIPSITKVDNNGRIYHILTNTPRALKPFLNIRFGCDAHNSHPHLFNSFLLEDYDISDSNLMSLYSAFKKIFELTEESCDYPEPGLKDWLHRLGVCNEEVDKMPDDVLFYMYLTTAGILWDYICSRVSILTHEEQDRNAIKTVMFAEVFYMNSLIPPEAVHKSKLEFLKLFNDIFPNVYLCIYALKSKQKEEEGDVLPCAMMKRESTIFHEILSEIYHTYPKSKVVSVHDAIYVLNHKGNLNITHQDIEGIMLQVYNRHRMSPTIAVEYYNDKP